MNSIKILRPTNLPAALISVLLAALSFYLIFNKIEHLPPEIPFWYSKVWGPGRLADPSWLWLIPSLIIIVLLINQLIAKLLDSKALIHIITWSTVIFGIIIIYSLFRILLLVT